MSNSKRIEEVQRYYVNIANDIYKESIEKIKFGEDILNGNITTINGFTKGDYLFEDIKKHLPDKIKIYKEQIQNIKVFLKDLSIKILKLRNENSGFSFETNFENIIFRIEYSLKICNNLTPLKINVINLYSITPKTAFHIFLRTENVELVMEQVLENNFQIEMHNYFLGNPKEKEKHSQIIQKFFIKNKKENLAERFRVRLKNVQLRTSHYTNWGHEPPCFTKDYIREYYDPICQIL